MVESLTITTEQGSVTMSDEELRRAARGHRGPHADAWDKPYPVPTQSKFVDVDGRKVEFLPDDQATSIMQRLLADYDGFAKLADFDIEILWKKKGGNSGGMDILGKCTKPSGAFKHLTHLDFLILLGADTVEARGFTYRQVEALIYHELCHADCDENGKPKTVGHDFELFADELREYGMWRENLERLGAVFKQLELW